MSYSCDFSEKELLNDLLMSENQIASSYNSGITKTTSKNLRLSLNLCLTNAQDCQFEILDAMKQRGWYQVREADHNDVENAKKKFSRLSNGLS